MDSRWLAKSDVAKSSAHDYNREGWLEREMRGVYRRPFPHTDARQERDWKIAVLSAQWIMGYDFHVGGLTALKLDGHSHYLEFGRSGDVYVYGDIPKWLPKLNIDGHFVPRRRQLFGTDQIGVDNRAFDPAAENAPSPWNWPFRRSVPERAVLEALNEVPAEESFETMDILFQSLSTLRPARLTQLLLACKSVKVRRLFFLFADRSNHGWNAYLDREKIDLGSGPRSLAEGGSYAAAYQLVVPDKFASTSKDTNNA